MSYRAKETMKVKEFSNRMKDLKIKVGKATGSIRFYWLDDHLEVEEKLWHPVIMLKYLLILVLYVPLLAFSNGAAPIVGFNSFRSSNHPTAKLLTNKAEIEDAIQKDLLFRKDEFEKYRWV